MPIATTWTPVAPMLPADADLTAPADFTEFVEEWTPRIMAEARRRAFFEDMAEEVTQTILAQLWRNNHVDRWKAELKTKGYQSSFESWTWVQIRFRMTKIKRRLWIATNRGATVTETPDAIYEEHNLDAAGLQQTLQDIFLKLQAYPVVQSRDFAKLFSQLVEQAELDGKGTFAKIGRQNGVTRAAISDQVQRLRALPEIQQLHDLLLGQLD